MLVKKRIFYFFSLLFAVFVISHAQDLTFEALIQSRTDAITEFARKVGEGLEITNWCSSSQVCNETCAYHACSGSIGEEAICNPDFFVEACGDRGNKLVETENTCVNTDYPDGSLLNLKRAVYRTPRDAVTSEGEGEPIFVTNEDLRRDFCALKTIESDVVQIFAKYNLSIWMYAGTTNKAAMFLPGAPQCREDDDDQSVEGCHYDPPSRPWYITAASGPRDIVFLFDRTSLTGASILRDAFKVLLGTLDSRDRIAVITFSNDDVDQLSTTPNKLQLESATSSLVGNISEALDILNDDDDSPNTTLAFETAFDLLQNADQTGLSSNCSKFIVTMVGQQDLCYDNCDSPLSCTCTSDIYKYIETRQNALSNSATIVTFTESKETDETKTNNLEQLARTIVCSENAAGAWRRVRWNDSPETAMQTFIQLAAQFLYEEELKVFASEIYEDNSGLGNMFTLAVPIYAKDVKRLLAVAGLDVTLAEVQELTGLSDVESISKITALSFQFRDCPSTQEEAQTTCSLQQLRSQAGSQICPYPLPASRYDCFRFGIDTYYPVTTPKSYDEAQEICANLSSGSSLAVVDTGGKNSFLSGLFSKDGSWIGLRANVGESLKWVSGSALTADQSRFYINYSTEVSNIHGGTNNDVCVTADSRGVDENWNLVGCGAPRPFVCQVSISENDTTCVRIFDGQQDTCSDLSLPRRTCSNEKDISDLEYAQPFCVQNGSDFTEPQRFCCDGGAAQTIDNTPDGSNQDTDEGLSVGAIVGIGMGVVVAVALLICLIRTFAGSNETSRQTKTTQTQKSSRPAPSKLADNTTY